MPYYGKRSKRRRYGRRGRRRYGKPRRAYGQSKLGYTLSVASKALAIARFAKSALNVEYKVHDTNPSGTQSTTTTYTLLNGLGQGDTGESRDGDKVRYKSLLIQGQWKRNTSATTTNIRCYLVIDKQTNGLQPDANSIFEADSDPFSLRNATYMKRYAILKTWVFTLNDDYDQKNIKAYIPLDMVTWYSGTGSTVSAIRNNSVYLVMVSDQPTNTPSYDLHTRMRYIDN